MTKQDIIFNLSTMQVLVLVQTVQRAESAPLPTHTQKKIPCPFQLLGQTLIGRKISPDDNFILFQLLGIVLACCVCRRDNEKESIY